MSLDWNRVSFYAQQYGIPDAIAKKMVEAESSGKQSAISPKGAIGLTQLMPGTARDLGVDPYDPEQNLEGGMRYLKQQYDAFGSWPLALAAYNAGPKPVQKAGGVPNYPETIRYLKRFKGIPEFGAIPDPSGRLSAFQPGQQSITAMQPLSASMTARPPPVRQMANIGQPGDSAMSAKIINNPLQQNPGLSSGDGDPLNQFINSPLTQLAAAMLAGSGGRLQGVGGGLLAIPQMQSQQAGAKLAQIKMMAELQKQAQQQQIQKMLMPMLSQAMQQGGGGANMGQLFAGLGAAMGAGGLEGGQQVLGAAPFFGMNAADAARLQMERNKMVDEIGPPPGGMPQGGGSYTMPAQPPTPMNAQPLGGPQGQQMPQAPQMPIAPPIPPGAAGLPAASQRRIAEEMAKKQNEAMLEEQKAAPGRIATAQKGMATIEEMAVHPGFSSGVGWEQMEIFGFKPFQTVSPTTAGFEALHKQVMGQQFLDSIPAMKGMGSLSNAEGDALRAAATSLDPKSTEEQYLRELARIHANLQRANERAMNNIRLSPQEQRTIGSATKEEVEATLQRLKAMRAGSGAIPSSPAAGQIDWSNVKATRVQ